MNRWKFILCFLLVFSVRVQASSALSSLASHAFDQAISDVTSAQQASSAPGRMGYYYGGSYKLSNPTVKPQVFSIESPSFSAGCNGIDANFGAISYLNGQDLKLMLRQTVSQGATYAFGLAMDAICGNCFANMQELARKVNKLSQDLVNSCQMAKAGINWTLNQADPSLKSASQAQQTNHAWWRTDIFGGDQGWLATGTKTALAAYPQALTDPYEGIRTMADKPVAQEIMSDPSTYSQQIPDTFYNATYKVLSAADVQGWFPLLTGTDTKTANNYSENIEFLMALVGTDIYSPVYDSNGNAGKAAAASPVPPTIEPSQIIDGTGKVSIDTCGDPAPNVANIPQGMTDQLKGQCMAYGTVNIPTGQQPAQRTVQLDNLTSEIQNYIADIANGMSARGSNAPAPTQSELRFMAVDPLNVVSILRNAGTRTQDYVSWMDNNAAKAIAEKLQIGALESILTALQDAEGFTLSDTAKKLMSVRIKELRSKVQLAEAHFQQVNSNTINYLSGADALKREINRQSEANYIRPLTNIGFR